MSSVKSKTGAITNSVPKVPCPKPSNVFYVWYGELCRRSNLTPLANVKPARPKNETVLDFTCDRIKVEDWVPILAALKQDSSLHVVAIRCKVECKFLTEIDTEKKAKEMRRKGGYLYTHFILTALIDALRHLVARSQVLMYLELDGIPLSSEYLGPLLDALNKSKSLKVLSFKYCPLRDNGCQQLCSYIKNIPNIEVLNLTACGLGSMSAQYLAQVIRYQQINRYSESWHCSLRYEDPDVDLMTGLKRITLNCNPNIGDEGLTHILNELDDDLWIKALDMQRCNITENISKRLVDVIDYSKSLEVADFRHNELLSDATVKKILEILKNKQHFNYDQEYEWCMTATSLPYNHSIQDTSSYTSTNLTKKCQKSASVKQVPKKPSNDSIPIRRIKTCCTIAKSKLSSQKEDVIELTAQLQKEIAKRLQTERENKELQKKLEYLESTRNGKSLDKKNIKLDVNKKNSLPRTKESLNIKIPLDIIDPIPEESPNHNFDEDKIEKKKDKEVEFVFTIDDKQEKSVAQSLFENLMYRNCEESDSEGERDIIEYYNGGSEQDENDADSDSASNSSLLKFMESFKSNVKFDGLDCGRQSNRRTWENNKSRKIPIVH
ncbi:centrosomal protein of 78 kDa [Onthophagus taurus]|uniref:centrosomal protein of 78 kDa n=1 Tax=Onthophagus taurus TaxID=166361 RepID=UPI000C20F5F8|nr:centrosomal protein of 78 kDa [Onthophagus taurus]